MNKRATLKIFLRHAWRYPWLTSIVTFCAIISSVVTLIPPLFYKQLFDQLGSLPTPSVYHELVWILIKILMAHMSAFIIYRLWIHLNAYWQPKVMSDLTVSSYGYLIRHSFDFFSNAFAGSLVRKVQRLGRSFETISDKYHFDLGRLIIQIPGMAVLLFSVSPWISFTVVVWCILFITVIFFFSRWKLRFDLQKAELDSKATGVLADGLTNSTTMKLFSSHRFEIKLLDEAMESLRKLRTFTWRLNGYLDAAQHFLMILIEFVLFYMSLRFWQRGQLSVGDFVLMQSLLLMLFDRVWGLGRVMRELYEAYADADEMVTILQTPYGIQDVPRAKVIGVKRGEIVFDHVSFAYRQTRQVLTDVHLRIASGEKIAFVGPSGAGKSTVTKLLLRFYDPTDGNILIDGQKISQVTQDSLRNAVSYVPQDPILFHRTLMENIRYARPRATDAEVIKAAKLAHCHEFIQEFPEKYETFVGERGVKLSGGERQRVAIARAILKNAPILILDEATSSLDSESEHLIQDALDKLMKGKTTMVIAHRLSTVMKMDRIVEMQNGRVTDTGTHQELLARKGGMYRKLWEIQAGGFEG